jgi:hypothetical protein
MTPVLFTAIPHGVNTAAGVNEHIPSTVIIVDPLRPVLVVTVGMPSGVVAVCLELQEDIRLNSTKRVRAENKKPKFFSYFTSHRTYFCIMYKTKNM